MMEKLKVTWLRTTIKRVVFRLNNFPPDDFILVYKDIDGDVEEAWIVHSSLIRTALSDYSLGYNVIRIQGKMRGYIPLSILEKRGLARLLTDDETREKIGQS